MAVGTRLREAPASRFQILSPLVRSVQKSASIRLETTRPALSSVSHIPVTPRWSPPKHVNGTPLGDVILRLGAKLILAAGKNAGGN